MSEIEGRRRDSSAPLSYADVGAPAAGATRTMMPPRPKPKRILLKLSGEALMGDLDFGIDDTSVARFAAEIADVNRTGTEVALVVGGGNLFRGMAISAKGGDRVTGDHMGMLATVMNALALEAALSREGLEARAMSAIEMPSICETYVHRRASWHMSRNVIVVLAGGTGNPFFTTDSGAALRALELECDALLKGTQVDGVYSADPRRDPSAVRYEHVTFQEAITKGLAVMDTAAFALARDNGLPIIVFNVHEPGSLARIVAGEAVGTLVSAG
jgi:uridylate kinase